MSTPSWIRPCSNCDGIMWNTSIDVKIDENYEYECRDCDKSHEVPFPEHEVGNEHNLYRVKRSEANAIFHGLARNTEFLDFINSDDVKVLDA